MTIENQVKSIGPPSVIPTVWKAQGRVGVVFNDQSENAGFEVEFTENNYRLVLTGTLGFGQFIVQSNEQDLLVNNKSVSTGFKQWMINKFAWYIPIEKLPAIIFMHDQKNTNDWEVDITRYQNINGFSFPRVVRLNHLRKAIKIKLVLGEINQLK